MLSFMRRHGTLFAVVFGCATALVLVVGIEGQDCARAALDSKK